MLKTLHYTAALQSFQTDQIGTDISSSVLFQTDHIGTDILSSVSDRHPDGPRGKLDTRDKWQRNDVSGFPWAETKAITGYLPPLVSGQITCWVRLDAISIFSMCF